MGAVFSVAPAFCVYRVYLVPPWSVGSWLSRPGYAKVGGVRTVQTALNFEPGRAQWPGGKKGKPLRFFPPDESAKLTVRRPP